MLIIKDNTFQEKIIDSKGNLLVLFGAPWCTPCKNTEALLRRFESQLPQVQMYYINVAENEKTSSGFKIRRVPTICLFKDGQMVDHTTEPIESLNVLMKFLSAFE